jgi:hypothetical protein
MPFPRRFLPVAWLLSFLGPLLVAVAAPTRGGALQVPLPLFPPNNWWNLDISTWPVDTNSTAYINFIGANDGLHPDFGGDADPPEIYGFPYVVVDAAQPKRAVEFYYSDESDGVDHNTNQSFPFYPIPDEAIAQTKWIEGGYPGNQCVGGDRHMLIVDKDANTLYELYDLCWDGSRWTGGSGAFFDMKTNNRRPEGWTSADAAGLAILPGLVRYDEAFGSDEIDHAFRVTVNATNGHVYPASHTAGSTGGALPMGARLRLKANKAISGFPTEIQRIFRAMKKYGLIVADNGTDMYISGTYDTRWNNDVLNPAFGALKASDFEVIQLGYNPPPAAPTVSSVSPTVGPSSGGTTVTVSGGSFVTGASASFGGAAASNVAVSRSTRLTAVAPAHAVGTVNVVVTNPDGQSATLPGAFTYCNASLPTASNNGPICTGGTLQLTATGPAGTYSWSGPNGFTSAQQNPQIPSATAAASGTYSVTVTVAGCTSAPATTTASVSASPTATVSGGGMAICLGDSTTVQAALTGLGPWDLTWSDGFMQTVSASPVKRTVSPAQTTTYQVTSVSGAACSGTASGSAPVTVDSTASCGSLYTVTPCRLADTRNAPDGPALAANTTRTFLVGGRCGIPSDAKAVAIVLTVVNETDVGNLRVFPAEVPAPLASAINFGVNRVRTNNGIFPLGLSGQIVVRCDMPQGSAGSTHLIMDATGYVK